MEGDEFMEFLKHKIYVMKDALEEQDDVLFLDADIILLQSQNHTAYSDKSLQLGVSPAYIKKENIKEVGMFNAGYIWTNQKSMPDKWLSLMKDSEYYEQKPIETLIEHYKTFLYDEDYNVQAWRLLLSPVDIREYIHNKDDVLHYKTKSMKCIHTHFREQRFEEFNKLIIGKMLENRDYIHLAIIFRAIYGNWVITIPKQPIQGIGFHANDSFRELITLAMDTTEDLSVIEDPIDSIHCRLHPNILLYDRPTMEWMNKEADMSSLVYLGNMDYKDHQKHSLEMRPWMFWGRRPTILEKEITSGVEKEYEVIFIGNIENDTQELHRPLRWGDAFDDKLDKFIMTKGKEHPLTQEEYLQEMKKARYGLCLRGYGEKTHREIECLALGVVPIMTKESAQHSYLNPLIEGTHYILVSEPQEIKEKIKSITQLDWMRMSQAGKDYYIENCHSRNVLKQMVEDLLFGRQMDDRPRLVLEESEQEDQLLS
tara:strand:- start:871 stop:2319 length:1449 start_codon:yes stop_codon:yes gene_type:complete